MRHIVIDGEEHEAQAEVLYCVSDKHGDETFAWSPDGEGFYWYDTYEEAVDQHGTQQDRGPIVHVDEITDF